MIENDSWIKRQIELGNLGDLDVLLVNPASVDIKLGRPVNHFDPFGKLTEWKHSSNTQLQVTAGSRLLCCSKEITKCPDTHAWIFTLKSSIGRRGFVLSHPGWGDPGFVGQITFSLFAAQNTQITIGERIGQLIFVRMAHIPDSLYKGRYQNSTGVTPERQMPEKLINPFDLCIEDD